MVPEHEGEVANGILLPPDVSRELFGNLPRAQLEEARHLGTVEGAAARPLAVEVSDGGLEVVVLQGVSVLADPCAPEHLGYHRKLSLGEAAVGERPARDLGKGGGGALLPEDGDLVHGVEAGVVLGVRELVELSRLGVLVERNRRVRLWGAAIGAGERADKLDKEVLGHAEIHVRRPFGAAGTCVPFSTPLRRRGQGYCTARINFPSYYSMACDKGRRT